MADIVFTYNGKRISPSSGKVLGFRDMPSMAANTLLFRFSDTSYDPSSLTTLTDATWTQVSSEPNVWLWDASSVQATDWSSAFVKKWTTSTNQVELIDAGVLTRPLILGQDTNPWNGIFAGNSYLVSVCPLRIPNATNCSRLFNRCLRLSGNVVIRCPSATTITDMFGGNNNTSNTAMTSATIITSSSLVTANQAFRGCTALQSFSISNTESVQNFGYLCTGCQSLQTVPLFDTSSVTTMTSMFSYCTSLTSVPLFNTSKVTHMSLMFSNCRSVQSGALALYQQASTQIAPPGNHSNCFWNCGADTVSGQAELAQIPTSWGGTLAE